MFKKIALVCAVAVLSLCVFLIPSKNASANTNVIYENPLVLPFFYSSYDNGDLRQDLEISFSSVNVSYNSNTTLYTFDIVSRLSYYNTIGAIGYIDLEDTFEIFKQNTLGGDKIGYRLEWYFDSQVGWMLELLFCLFETNYSDDSLVVIIGGLQFYVEEVFGQDFDNWITGNKFIDVISANAWRFEELPSSYQEGYNTGYNVARDINDSTQFDKGYNEGYNTGVSSVDTDSYYNNGYNVGHSKGYQEGLTVAENDFDNLFFGIADTPLKIIHSVLSFDVFGISAYQILFSLITLLLVIFLVKKFML